MRGRKIDLSEIFGRSAQMPEQRPKAPDVQARLVTDALADWFRPCRFKKGDLVKPTGYGMWRPTLGVCAVSEVLAEPIRQRSDRDGDFKVVTFDMRVLATTESGLVHEIEVCSRDFALYTGPIGGVE